MLLGTPTLTKKYEKNNLLRPEIFQDIKNEIKEFLGEPWSSKLRC